VGGGGVINLRRNTVLLSRSSMAKFIIVIVYFHKRTNIQIKSYGGMVQCYGNSKRRSEYY